MKPLTRLIILALAALLTACANVKHTTGVGVSQLQLLGGDAAGVTFRNADGSGVQIEQIQTSPAFGKLTDLVGTLGMQKLVLGPLAKGWVGNRGKEIDGATSIETTKLREAGLTERARLAPIEPAPVAP